MKPNSKLSVCAALVSVALLPAVARAAEGGWAWAHLPTTTNYAPSSLYSWNSAGAAISLTTTGVGMYEARFTGLGALSGGTVLVSSYQDLVNTGTYCNIENWSNTGTFSAPVLLVKIRCYDSVGNAANSKYVVTYSRFSGSSPVESSFAWQDLIATSGTPNPSYQWNSFGSPITSTYQGDGGSGTVTVTRPGISDNNVAMVSAYGLSGAHCRADTVFRDGLRAMYAPVTCYSATGQPGLSRFTITLGKTPFHTPTGSFAWGLAGGTSGSASGYVQVNGAAANSQIMVQISGTGKYQLTWPGITLQSRSVAMVSANDLHTAAACSIDSWGNVNQAATVKVSCRSLATGQLTPGFFYAAVGSN
jgi:hypothetical protein